MPFLLSSKLHSNMSRMQYLGRMLALIVVALAVALSLTAAYAQLAKLIAVVAKLPSLSDLSPTLDTPAWMIAAIFHSLLSVAILAYYFKRGTLHQLWCQRPGNWLLYAPAALVLLGVASLVLVSRAAGGGYSSHAWSMSQWAWIFWVPVVEEIVFRAGIGAWMRHFAGLFLGSWFAALTFALVHTAPTLSQVLHGEIGLPLGPFILGLVCEILFGLSGRLLPGIVLHMVCNATVVIFAWGDARWLQWLSFLYI